MKDRNKIMLFTFLIFLGSSLSFGQTCSPANSISLGNDTTLCVGQTLTLSVPNPANYDHITWENNATTATRTITTGGTYAVKATITGSNILTNGDFEHGNSGFTTEYTVGTGGSWGLLSLEGTYAITTSPSLVHNNFLYCTDHTPGTGQYEMVVNGSGSSGTKVWCQTVAVTPNTDYEFSTWATNVIYSSNVAQLQFTINGTSIGNVFSTSSNSCDWSQFFEQWNSGPTTTSAEICITNLNTLNAGNDFAIDDISFAPICVYQDTIVVNYLNYPTFSAPTTYNNCEGDTVYLDAENPGFHYVWDNSAVDTNQTLKVFTSGTHEVEVSNDGGLCAATQTFNLTFHTPPNAGNDSIIAFCNTDNQVNLFNLLAPSTATSGSWFDTTNTAVANGLVTITNNEGIEPFTYVLPQQYCPNDTAIISLDVKEYLSAGDDYTQHICNDLTVNFNPLLSASKTGGWSSLDGLSTQYFNPTTGVFTLNNLTKGTYSFQYIIPNTLPCPSDTALFTFDVSEVPTVKFTADTTNGCSPLQIHFNDLTEVNGTKEFEWNIEGEVQGGNSPDLDYTFTAHHSYDVGLKITTDGLCENDTTYTNYITVYPDPVADFKFSPVAVFSNNPEVNFENQSEMNAENHWYFADLDSSQEVNPEYTFPLGKEGDYTVSLLVVSDKNCRDSVAIVVPIKTHTLFFVPNAFTPDGDFYNGIFKPVMSVNVDPDNYGFYVFNRWGEMLFESHNYDIGWDGSYHGKLVQDGVYIWKLSFKELSSDKIISKKGTICLIR